MLMRVNQSSGVPLYVQLIEQIKHAVETGAIEAGEQLPTIRKMAEDLVMNPNTVARAYRELEREGIIDLKHGSGAYIADALPSRSKIIRKAQAVVQAAVGRLVESGLKEDEIRRLVESELARLGAAKLEDAGHE